MLRCYGCYGSNLAHERSRVFRRIHSPLLDVSDGEYPGIRTMVLFKRDNHDYCDGSQYVSMDLGTFHQFFRQTIDI